MQRISTGLLALAAAFLSSPVLAGRIDATANISFYVATPGTCGSSYWWDGGANTPVTTCGDDVAGDGSVAHPWATCQHAMDYAYNNIDWHGNAPIVNMASKTAPGQNFYPLCRISGRLVGQAGTLEPMFATPGNPPYKLGKYNPIILRGDHNNPLGAFLTSGQFGFPTDGPAFSMTEAAAEIDGLAFDSGTVLEDNIDVMGNSILGIGKIYVGNAGHSYVDQHGVTQQTYNLNIGCAFSSLLYLKSGGSIDAVGNALAIIQTGDGCPVIANNNTGQTGFFPINIHGTTYTQSPFMISGGVFYKAGITVTGSFTAPWGIVANHNATIDSGTGPGPNTCPPNMILGHPSNIEDHSSCR